jgi:bacterial/archaeal transporter family protein
VKVEWLILISILGSGIGNFLYKYATNSMQPLVVAGFSLLVYLVLLPIGFLITKPEITISLAGVCYTVVSAICLCAGTLGIAFALRAGEPVGKVVALTSVYPAITLLLSCLFLGEPITIKKVIGIVLAIVAVGILL